MSKDMEELITKYGGYLLKKTNRCNTIEKGASLILEKLKNKEALKIFQKMLVQQGVDEQTAYELCVNRNYSAVFEKKSKFTSSIKAKQAGYIKSIDALILGNTAAKLGAGRAKSGKLLKYLLIEKLLKKFKKKGDKISFEVGFRLLKSIGDKIDLNETWLEVYHNSTEFEKIFSDVLINSIEFQEEPFNVESLVIKIMDYE